MSNPLTLDALEGWHWESANILRGSIDSSDFKNYIFGLLFLKRFNDVFDERVRAAKHDEYAIQRRAGVLGWGHSLGKCERLRWYAFAFNCQRHPA